MPSGLARAHSISSWRFLALLSALTTSTSGAIVRNGIGVKSRVTL